MIPIPNQGTAHSKTRLSECSAQDYFCTAWNFGYSRTVSNTQSASKDLDVFNEHEPQARYHSSMHAIQRTVIFWQAMTTHSEKDDDLKELKI